MAVMLFCMSALAVFFTVAWILEEIIPDEVQDKVLRIFKFN